MKQLVAMAGGFPEGNEFNVHKHASASVETFTKWPTRILFSGFEIGAKIFTGARVASVLSLKITGCIFCYVYLYTY